MCPTPLSKQEFELEIPNEDLDTDIVTKEDDIDGLPNESFYTQQAYYSDELDLDQATVESSTESGNETQREDIDSTPASTQSLANSEIFSDEAESLAMIDFAAGQENIPSSSQEINYLNGSGLFKRKRVRDLSSSDPSDCGPLLKVSQDIPCPVTYNHSMICDMEQVAPLSASQDAVLPITQRPTKVRPIF